MWVPVGGWSQGAKITYVSIIYCLYMVFFTAKKKAEIKEKEEALSVKSMELKDKEQLIAEQIAQL